MKEMKLGRVSIFFFLAKMDFFILLCINICYFVIGIKPKKKKTNLKESERGKKREVTLEAPGMQNLFLVPSFTDSRFTYLNLKFFIH